MLTSGKLKGNDIGLMSRSILPASFSVFSNRIHLLPLRVGVFAIARCLLSLRISSSPVSLQNCPDSR